MARPGRAAPRERAAADRRGGRRPALVARRHPLPVAVGAARPPGSGSAAPALPRGGPGRLDRRPARPRPGPPRPPTAASMADAEHARRPVASRCWPQPRLPDVLPHPGPGRRLARPPLTDSADPTRPTTANHPEAPMPNHDPITADLLARIDPGPVPN